MHDLTVVGNLVEAGLWLAFALTFAVRAWRASGRKRRLWAVLSLAFLAFSASDVIESQTGAWWRPWWLLLLKGSCLALFVYVAREFRKLAASAGAKPPAGPDPAPEVGAHAAN